MSDETLPLRHDRSGQVRSG